MEHSPVPDQPAGAQPQRRTGAGLAAWLGAGLAALAASALVAFGVWAGLSGTNDSVVSPAAAAVNDGFPTGARTADAAPQSTLQPKAGDCLLRTGGSGEGEITVVPCAEAHHMEVVGVVDSAGIISGAPSDAEWLALLDANCEALLQDHLGTLWDPQGRFRLRVSAPGPAEWLQGDHTGECLVILRSGADGEVPSDDAETADMPLFRGAVRDLEQARRYLPGSCLAQAVVIGAPPTPVACERPHHFQVLEPLDLSDRFSHAPDHSQWASLDEQCIEVLRTRFGAAAVGPAGHPLVGSTVRMSVRSWLAGSHHSACLVSEMDPATGQPLEQTAALIG